MNPSQMRHLLVLNIPSSLILKVHHQIMKAIYGITDGLPDSADVLILLDLFPTKFLEGASEAFVVREHL